jgi:hypothetical protein
MSPSIVANDPLDLPADLAKVEIAVAERLGDLRQGPMVDEVGTQGLVTAMSGLRRPEEELPTGGVVHGAVSGIVTDIPPRDAADGIVGARLPSKE